MCHASALNHHLCVCCTHFFLFLPSFTLRCCVYAIIRCVSAIAPSLGCTHRGALTCSALCRHAPIDPCLPIGYDSASLPLNSAAVVDLDATLSCPPCRLHIASSQHPAFDLRADYAMEWTMPRIRVCWLAVVAPPIAPLSFGFTFCVLSFATAKVYAYVDSWWCLGSRSLVSAFCANTPIIFVMANLVVF